MTTDPPMMTVIVTLPAPSEWLPIVDEDEHDVLIPVWRPPGGPRVSAWSGGVDIDGDPCAGGLVEVRAYARALLAAAEQVQAWRDTDGCVPG